MATFNWLEGEIAAVKTPRFHVVDGPADQKLRGAMARSNLKLPSSYKDFVTTFGNAKLYRNRRDGYRVGVFAGPREATLNGGQRIYHLGFHDGASVYVKPEFESQGLPIFEFEDGREEKVADDFAEWLKVRCAAARRLLGKKKWQEILRGPAPFTPSELELIQTRRLIQWRVLGINPSGDHIFEITNTSQRTLPFMTIGIRSKDLRLNGAIRLDVGHVEPRRTAVLHKDCYKNLRPPAEIEAFALPDPQPEDREFYYEFGMKL